MEISIVANRQVFEAAVAAARPSNTMELDGLASIVNSALLGRIEEVWDSIEVALRHGFQFGKEKASDLMTKAVHQTEQLLTEAGDLASRVQDEILQRLHAFTKTFVDGMLARIPITVKIGGIEYALRTVKLDQKLVASGALKTNLVEVFSLTANGEIEIGAEYVMPSAKGGVI
jgi:hypothetical protein